MRQFIRCTGLEIFSGLIISYEVHILCVAGAIYRKRKQSQSRIPAIPVILGCKRLSLFKTGSSKAPFKREELALATREARRGEARVRVCTQITSTYRGPYAL